MHRRQPSHRLSQIQDALSTRWQRSALPWRKRYSIPWRTYRQFEDFRSSYCDRFSCSTSMTIRVVPGYCVLCVHFGGKRRCRCRGSGLRCVTLYGESDWRTHVLPTDTPPNDAAFISRYHTALARTLWQ